MSSRRRALISVSDKQGIVELARELARLSFDIISTGGTAKTLRDGGVDVIDVATLTGFAEIMDGRVKTLHPAIHGGLLARAGLDEPVLHRHGIALIDLLIVNLYPFEQTIAEPDCSDAQAIENIDVGGPAMLRAAAKNHARVTVVVDHADYANVLAALRTGDVSLSLRRALATKAFAHTAAYDVAIARYLRAEGAPTLWPDPLLLTWRNPEPLRYGENPHQQAALYRSTPPQPGTIAHAVQLQGKPLSFNNLVDADTALACGHAFDDPVCVIVKHANPCGVAIAESVAQAYAHAYACDPTSAFGGVIAFNRALDEVTAQAIVGRQFAEVIVATEVEEGARAVLAQKAGIRVLELGSASRKPTAMEWDSKLIGGGLLLQQPDVALVPEADLKTVTKRAPDESELRDLLFGWRVVKFVKSNAVVYARGGRTVGIGAGQMSRVMSARIAAIKAAEENLPLGGAVVASDAFFPFRDGIDVAAGYGIGAVIQPGGSMRDEEVIRAADEHGMAMVFTGMRHFRH